jgi:hypothetical protein
VNNLPESPFFGRASARAAIELTDELAGCDSGCPAEKEPDYEALGYPETELGITGVFTLDIWVDRLLWCLLDAGVDWCRATDKKNQDDIEKG